MIFAVHEVERFSVHDVTRFHTNSVDYPYQLGLLAKWIESRRYLGLDLIQQSLAVGTEQEEETDTDLALSA